MGYDLQTEPGPAALAPLGQVELRELPYGQMRAVMAASDQPGQSAERLMAASMHVDGQPLGYEALQALPGRFAGGITTALTQCLRMHGLATEPEPAAEGPKA